MGAVCFLVYRWKYLKLRRQMPPLSANVPATVIKLAQSIITTDGHIVIIVK